jgi:hypothetical protein
MWRWAGAFTRFMVWQLASESDFSAGSSLVVALEGLKDRILAAVDACPQLSEDTRSMWRGDAKEMYYLVRLAEHLLSHDVDTESARGPLQLAYSRYEQVRSELRSMGQAGQRLEQELTGVFSACRDSFAARLPETVAASEPERVTKPAEQQYILPCSVCGKTAVDIHPAGSAEKILKGIICRGITRGVGLKVADQEKIFGWLEKADLAALHHYIGTDADIEGGLDAYCPTCDRIYCRTHYNVSEEWDEGFYDCSRGTCPQGHKRLVDD